MHRSSSSPHPRIARWRRLFGAWIAAAALVACAPDEADSLADADAEPLAIVQGQRVDSYATEDRYGLVSINGCSAVALNSRWALTMYHCGSRAGQYAKFLGRDYKIALSIYNNEYRNPDNPTRQNQDSQLFKLETPLIGVNGIEWRARYAFPTTLTPARLVGQQLLCFGAGGNHLWRQGTFTGSSKSDPTPGFLTLKSSSGAYLQAGDSGGPCFATYSANSGPELVSITKGAPGSSSPSGDYGGTVNVLRQDLWQWINFSIVAAGG